MVQGGGVGRVGVLGCCSTEELLLFLHGQFPSFLSIGRHAANQKAHQTQEPLHAQKSDQMPITQPPPHIVLDPGWPRANIPHLAVRLAHYIGELLHDFLKALVVHPRSILDRERIRQEQGFGFDRETVGQVDKEVFDRESGPGRFLHLDVVLVLIARTLAFGLWAMNS